MYLTPGGEGGGERKEGHLHRVCIGSLINSSIRITRRICAVRIIIITDYPVAFSAVNN